MFKRTALVVGGLLVILAVIGFFFYGQVKAGKAQLANFAPPVATVTATVVQQEAWRPMVSTVGTLTAREGIDLSNEVSGIIESLPFASGHKVEKGQLLVELNDEMEQANLVSFEAQAELARTLFIRNKKMYKERNISETDFDEARSNLAVAEAGVLQTEAAIAKKNILAPFSGTLGIWKVNVGDYVGSGTKLVTLQDSSRLYVDFSVPEQNLPRLYVGQDVEFKVTAYGARVFHGKVLAIEAKIDEGTRNIAVRADVDNKFGTLRPGMYADIKLLMRESEAVVVVPSTAVSYSQFGDSMFVVEDGEKAEDGSVSKKVRQVFVRLGERRGDYVAVTSGIIAGDLVVDAGVQKLSNNAAVIVSDK
ncbi:membrane fusion protein (multidrug efflux system) [Sinobacterium caligoides]|uniref:Membrane fusion protein (Multidrug efflux system) n=1 Tax=Sinobacterium caligoides TaxID=933926 RepID=A0A3N2DPB0_9GAMM|nr:efflux RND transporter periplasmic adaptor subunit [Sinobacterium caligoides]ROS01489.1 membrane fusion protein (multidrug efflux system) [Sinobacterium caligoides]